MSAPEEILNQIPLDQLAASLGTDEATARKAALSAIPMLIGSMGDNARNDAEAQSLASALGQHANSPLLTRATLNVDDVDTEDGGKIVGHVLHEHEEPVVRTLGSGFGLDSATTQKLLKILAPIVMAWLAKKVLGGAGGGILGGGGDQPQQKAGGGILADLLEQLLPGAQLKREGRSGALGGLLDSFGGV